MQKVDPKVLYPDLSYNLVGLVYKTQNEMGRFAHEKQYANALEKYLIQHGIKYQREFEIPYKIGLEEIKGNRVDFLIENKIILELKSKRLITKQDYYQVKRYLEASNLSLGLLVNFREPILKPHRILNGNHS